MPRTNLAPELGGSWFLRRERPDVLAAFYELALADRIPLTRGASGDCAGQPPS